MIFKKKNIQQETEELPQIEVEVEKPQLKFVPSAKTVIGEGIIFDGDFETTDPIEVNGSLTGNINSNTSLSIGETGFFSGSAKVNTLLVDGNADATVDCADLAKLSDGAVMNGELYAKRLVAEDGAVFGGRLSLVPVTPEPEQEPDAEDDEMLKELFGNSSDEPVAVPEDASEEVAPAEEAPAEDEPSEKEASDTKEPAEPVKPADGE